MTIDLEESIKDIEQKISAYCNLVPIDTWGFDESVKESINVRKHSLVNRQLSKKERKGMSSVHKQQLARGLGLVPNTVEEVFNWMSKSKQLSKVQPIKQTHNVQQEKAVERSVPESKKVKNVEENDNNSDAREDVEKSNKESESEEESSDDDDDENDAQSTNSDENLNLNGTVEESSDEDEEPVIKKPKVEINKAKNNDKVDVEIQKLEEDENNEDPEIKRQIALLRLQKKLKEMKDDRRKGTPNTKSSLQIADKLREEKKLKRRESKLKLKQRRAEEKKNKEIKNEIKKEDVAENSIVDENLSKEKKLDVAFNRLNFEIKEDTKGKKQRTAKKDRKLKLTGRDYKSLIAKVEETKATIEKIREADPHKATIMEDELKWEKTMKRAAGGKVKDNLELLKKALNKKNKMKERKKEKWNNRINKVETEKNTKQDKRKANLQKRIDNVKAKKLAKLRKKGRVL